MNPMANAAAAAKRGAQIDPKKQLANAMKIVKAGVHVLYSPGTRKQLMQALEIKASPEEVIAVNVAGIIKILFDESGDKMPPESIGPAVVMLCYEMAMFLREAGMKMGKDTPQKAAQFAMKIVAKVLMGKMQAKAGQKQPPQQPPQQTPQQPQPQGGLISQAQPQMAGV